MNHKINISNTNILEGEKANPQNCAIARAIKSKLKKKVQEVSVLPTQVILKIDKKMFVAEMPKEGTNFIKRFDRGLAVNSFKLDLKFKKGYALVS
jgi:hypothetical protein